ncbi:MAG: hypothetical protein JWO08_1506 [Verrucomicrobiaceae bacterium]|nr:hypothetical protein [Verrucomicrobiaceae bacterium]
MTCIISRCSLGSSPCVILPFLRIYIFGSRRFQTRSTRSDVDLLLDTDGHVALEDVRDFAIEHCRALDFFIADGGTATSCANNSKVRAAGRRSLVRTLNAVLLWDRKNGFDAVYQDWEFEVIRGYDIPMTSMISGVPFPSKAEAISSLQPKGELPSAASQTAHTLVAFWSAATWEERFGMLLVYGVIFLCGVLCGRIPFFSKLYDLVKEVKPF